MHIKAMEHNGSIAFFYGISYQIMNGVRKMNGKITERIKEQRELLWINDRYLSFEMSNAVCELVVSDADIADAEKRLARFAPFIKTCFPETEETDGLIESPLTEISQMQEALQKQYDCRIPGNLYLKMDSHLAIAGSVKARGGIYEVLWHAEKLAKEGNMIQERESYVKFASKEMQDFLHQYIIQVGSTGNLGMSIGIISAALGFQVVVHMSADAKEWKKELLRRKGVTVVEYQNDYSKAVEEGRKLSEQNPNSYFVDDEKSVNLFLGYAVAAGRLQEQLKKAKIQVDEKHPLLVYIPAGVGGAPGGISYGLKRIFKDHVHCFFAEPVQCPSVLMGIATQKFEHANVHDYGLSGKTEADGLACASPSGFVTRIMTNLLSGDFTVEDGALYDYLRLLYQEEEIQIEPSSCAAFTGPIHLLQYEEGMNYCKAQGLTEDILKNATQIVWATGGKLVPKQIQQKYLETYIR